MSLSLIGKRIGNYDIQAKIGEGGMGMVYLGLHPQIGKRVAIKVLHEELSSKSDVVARFFTEARSVNDISHPNIVDIVDFGDVNLDGVVLKYIIMEFLDGEALATRIRREGVTIRETLHIIAQCASALSASHAKGVVHRDLKPENIYLCLRGPDRNYVKLLDFGIAKLTGDAGNAALSSRTRTGMVIGTPAYMSPEQCEGRGQIDHRSDIYALGVVMYELLTGRVPFPGEGFGEVLVAHLTREPEPPSQLNQNIPPEIEALVMHCLRKDKGQRFQSMDEFLQAVNDPAAHYQSWGHSAALPPGVMASNAMMSTVMSGVGGPWASGAMQIPANSSMLVGASQLMPIPPSGGSMGYGTGMVPMTPPTVPGLGPGSGVVNVSMGGTIALTPDGQPVLGTPGPRPTTLSGASGEAARPQRRPLPVLLGFVGALLLGGGVTAMVKNRKPVEAVEVPKVKEPIKDPVKEPGKDAQRPPTLKKVTIQVKSTPAGAEIVREQSGSSEKVTGPFQVDLGSAPVAITVKLDGYATETRSVTTDRDQSLEVTLVPNQAPVAVVEEELDKKKGGRRRPKEGTGGPAKEGRRGKKDKDKGGDGDQLLRPIF